MRTSYGLLLLLFLIASCYSGPTQEERVQKINQSMNVWVGKSEDDLVNAWGPPTRVFKLDDGSRVFTYNYGHGGRVIPGRRWRDGLGFIHYEPAIVVQPTETVREFTVGPNGLVNHTRWQGL